jgi:hypothetical protein
MARRTDTKPRLRIIRLLPGELEIETTSAAAGGNLFSPEVEALMRDCQRILSELTSSRRASYDDECDSEAEDKT